MAVDFPNIPQPNPVAAEAAMLANTLCVLGNASRIAEANEYKRQWEVLSNPLRPVEVQQALCDQLFAVKTTGLDGQPSTLLDDMFVQAYLWLTLLSTLSPNEFSLEACPVDINGRTLPDVGYETVPYQKYCTFGWIYTINQDGSITVSEPCKFVADPVIEEQPSENSD